VVFQGLSPVFLFSQTERSELAGLMSGGDLFLLTGLVLSRVLRFFFDGAAASFFPPL